MIEAFSYKLDKLLVNVLKNYHHQFKEELWKIFVWCMSTLSMGLSFLKVVDYEFFNSLICTYYNEIEDTVVADPNVEDSDKLQLRADMMVIVYNVIKSASDE